jgi:16S rRNA (cytosine1402-N4)-methyltransferase
VTFCTKPFLTAKEPGVLIDATFGAGGHCHHFLQALHSPHRIIALDQDENACLAGKKRFEKEIALNRLEILHCRFGEIAQIAQNHNVLACFADLGFSSDQMEDARYGLSFQKEGPLDMRLSDKLSLSCADLLQKSSLFELEKILFTFGEERFAKKIAKTIFEHQKKQPLKTTLELAQLIERITPAYARKKSRIHPATKSFQAFRIAVNQELDQLQSLLQALPQILKDKGHAAILSFHSLEDRMVKQAFADKSLFTKVNKKVIIPSEEEQKQNPRSRSAKLRLALRHAD